MKFSFAVIPAFVAAVSATTFTILVGSNNGLTYSPNQVTNATEGDVFNFQFVAKNHTVTQSTFASPCTQSGVDSGFFPVNASSNSGQVAQWSFTLNNASAPLWFYCRQTGHCAQGMVFAINPTATKSFQAFQAAANATASNSTTGTGSSGTGSSSSAPSPSASTSTTSGANARFSISSASTVALMGLAAGLLL